ncbi:hypothetical protein [Cupriavidus pampae]|uniref:hypothetical protein n=1 Tax=Cupriavidus pampae TaxID=659251 RepID=UPI001CC37D1E|nr:hypothetical protein [Cupriavidus pampae]
MVAINGIADGQGCDLHEICEHLVDGVSVAELLEERQQGLVRLAGIAFESSFCGATHRADLRRNGYAAVPKP